MAFLKRLSDNFWSYVSPQKTNKAALPTPKTDPTSKKPRRSPGHSHRRNLSKHARSMSPGERVDTWHLRSPLSQESQSVAGRKRRRLNTPTTSGAGRRRKAPKMDIDEEEYVGEGSLDGDIIMDDGYDDPYDEESYLALRHSSPGIRGSRPRSRPPSRGLDEDDESMSVDHSLVVSAREESPARPKLVSLPEEHSMRGISDEELRAQGRDDDYITLIQKIAMRGYEPLLPAYMKFEYKFLPDGLFEQGDDAFIASVRKDHFKGSKALEQLLELGGRVRDRIEMGSRVESEVQVHRQVKSYLSWALDDAGIDRNSYIPIFAIECQPAGTEAAVLRQSATRKCQRLLTRYREALRVQRSVEISPGSRSSNDTVLSYPLPTFYTIVASHTIVAIMAYNPEVAPEVTPMAFFDFKEKDYDVWNAFALAIVVCHVRNVLMRIAAETDIGLKQSGYSDEEMDETDPDA